MITVDVADVVVIDDDHDLRMLTRLTFQLQGWSVATAEDGRSGLELLRSLATQNVQPVVLLDVQMPDIDGWQVLAEIRSDPELRHIPVVLCTVRAGVEDQRRGFALGADGFVAKPFDIEDLVSEVQAYVDMPPSERTFLRDGDPTDG